MKTGRRSKAHSAAAEHALSAVVMEEAQHEAMSGAGNEAANDPALRQQMIASAAYLRAQQRGFPGGTELQDWLEAEAEVDRTLAGAERKGSNATTVSRRHYDLQSDHDEREP